MIIFMGLLFLLLSRFIIEAETCTSNVVLRYMRYLIQVETCSKNEVLST